MATTINVPEDYLDAVLLFCTAAEGPPLWYSTLAGARRAARDCTDEADHTITAAA